MQNIEMLVYLISRCLVIVGLLSSEQLCGLSDMRTHVFRAQLQDGRRRLWLDGGTLRVHHE